MAHKKISKIATVCVVAAFLCLGTGCGRSDSGAAAQDQQAAADKQGAANSIKQADELYAQRSDLARVRQGIVLLKQARNADPASYDAAWKLAQYDYYLGSHTTDNTERDKAFREGVEAGKAAVKLQDGKPEGHFWLGANYGGIAQNSTLGGLTGLDEIRTQMEAVLKIDQGYQSASAYMVLGQLDLEAPKALGGDAKRAVDELEKGLRVGGDKNALLRLQLAEAYIENKRPDDARKQLNAIISMTPDPQYAPEHREAVAEAQKLLGNGLKVD